MVKGSKHIELYRFYRTFPKYLKTLPGNVMETHSLCDIGHKKTKKLCVFVLGIPLLSLYTLLEIFWFYSEV